MEVIKHAGKQATEVRQASLINAALQLAAQRSPATITTTDLANAIGITQGAVFRHFSSKEAVWLAVIDWVSVTLIARLNAAAAATNTPIDALRAVFMTHVSFVMEHPGVPRVIFQELQSPDDTALKASVRLLMHSYRLLVVQLLTQAKYKNFIAADTDLTGASVLFIGSIQGLVMQSLMTGNVSAMSLQAPGVFTLFQRGLMAKEPF